MPLQVSNVRVHLKQGPTRIILAPNYATNSFGLTICAGRGMRNEKENMQEEHAPQRHKVLYTRPTKLFYLTDYAALYSTATLPFSPAREGTLLTVFKLMDQFSINFNMLHRQYAYSGR